MKSRDGADVIPVRNTTEPARQSFVTKRPATPVVFCPWTLFSARSTVQALSQHRVVAFLLPSAHHLDFSTPVHLPIQEAPALSRSCTSPLDVSHATMRSSLLFFPPQLRLLHASSCPPLSLAIPTGHRTSTSHLLHALQSSSSSVRPSAMH